MRPLNGYINYRSNYYSRPFSPYSADAFRTHFSLVVQNLQRMQQQAQAPPSGLHFCWLAASPNKTKHLLVYIWPATYLSGLPLTLILNPWVPLLGSPITSESSRLGHLRKFPKVEPFSGSHKTSTQSDKTKPATRCIVVDG